MLALIALALTAQPALPPVVIEDLARFPEGDLKLDALRAARKHYQNCRDQRAMNMSPQLPWRQWEREAGYVAQCWERLDGARGSGFGRLADLDELAELRRLIGPEMYYAGRMPIPAVQEYDIPFDLSINVLEVLPMPREDID